MTSSGTEAPARTGGLMRFADILEAVRGARGRRIAVAAAADADVLAALGEVRRMGVAQPVLVGDREAIAEAARTAGVSLDGMELVHVADNAGAVQTAVRMVASGEADVLMKGLLTTAELLRGVLNKEWGLAAGITLSHIAILESPVLGRSLLMTDAGMVMYPDLKTKVDLVKNAVKVARALGADCPKVACIAAVEMVNPNMPATLDAAAIAKMGERGQLGRCVADGPLALDNALSAEAAAHKGIVSPVAGAADILLMPNIEAGNVLFKAAHYLGECGMGGLIAGARAPIVLTSRADTAQSKINSIAAALLASGK